MVNFVICEIFLLNYLSKIRNKYFLLFASIPEWAERAMEPCGDLEYLAMFWFKIFTPTKGMKKLKSGFLLKEILDRFTAKMESKLSPDRSLWMYFAHDITLSNMLNTLGLFEVTKLHVIC